MRRKIHSYRFNQHRAAHGNAGKEKKMKTGKQLLMEAKREVMQEMASEKKEDIKSILRQMCAMEDALKLLKKQIEELSK